MINDQMAYATRELGTELQHQTIIMCTICHFLYEPHDVSNGVIKRKLLI